MLDIKRIKENPEEVIDLLARKGKDARETIERILELDNQRRVLVSETDNLNFRFPRPLRDERVGARWVPFPMLVYRAFRLSFGSSFLFLCFLFFGSFFFWFGSLLLLGSGSFLFLRFFFLFGSVGLLLFLRCFRLLRFFLFLFCGAFGHICIAEQIGNERLYVYSAVQNGGKLVGRKLVKQGRYAARVFGHVTAAQPVRGKTVRDPVKEINLFHTLSFPL